MEAAHAEALWTMTDVARYLGVPPMTVQTWRARRTGPPAFRVGRHVRYRREDVDRWLEEQRDRSSSGAAS